MANPPPPEPFSRLDAVLAVLFALAAGIATYHLAQKVPLEIFSATHPDVFFSSDTSRVNDNLHSTESSHWRTVVHPIASLLLYPLYHGVAAITGADLSGGSTSPDSLQVTRLVSALASALTAGLFFSVLRRSGRDRATGIVFTFLAACSAWSIFWFSIPETYPWGCLTLLLCLWLAARGDSAADRPWASVLVSALSLSITTTNWMAGIAQTFFRHRLATFIKITVAAFALVVALSFVQRYFFPSSWFFFKPPLQEKNYMLQSDQGGPLVCLRGLIFHSVVMPEPVAKPHSRVPDLKIYRTQTSPIGSGGALGLPAALLWGALLTVGAVHAVRQVRQQRPLQVLLVVILGQLCLHTVYGNETFLYAAHIGPLLILMASYAAQGSWRWPVLGAASVLSILLLINNLSQFFSVCSGIPGLAAR